MKRSKKLHKKAQHKFTRRRSPKASMPFIFAGFFAVLMVIYGLTQIFAAQPPIAFSLTPATQTASGGQTKTLAVQMNPSNQNVYGGSVKITYDANRLTFSKFTENQNSPYYTFSEVNSSGSYSFDFFEFGGSSSATTIGTIEFKVKTIGSNMQTSIAFAADGTDAYIGYNPSYYSVQLTGATMDLQAPVQPEKCALDSSLLKTDPKCTPCTYNAAIIASNPNCKKPTTPTNPTTPTTPSKPSNPNPGNPSVGTPPSTNGPQPTDPSTTENPSSSDPNDTESPSQEHSNTTSVPAKTKKKLPLIAIASVVGGMLLLGGLIFAFIKRQRKDKDKDGHPPVPEVAGALAAGLVDKKEDDTAVTGDAAVTQPSIEEAVADYLQDTPQVPESPAPAVEPETPTITLEQPIQPKVPEPAVVAQPTKAPADAVAEAALAALASKEPKPEFKAALERDAAAYTMPKPPEPAWQTELKQKQTAAHAAEPEDMFETAAKHPELYHNPESVNNQPPPAPPAAPKVKKP